MKSVRIFSLAFLILIFAFSTLSYAGVPQMMNYQGKITKPTGALVDTIVQMTFTIYDDSTSGNVLWADTLGTVAVEKGIFSVLLGSVNPLPDSVFTGDIRYLGVKVGADPEMTPRKEIVSVAYAYKAQYADTAANAQVAVSDGDWAFRITDTADTTLITGGEWGIARSGNTLYGDADSTHVNLGVACTTGSSGQNYKGCTVAGGGQNKAANAYATVAGGLHNTASGLNATVTGGYGNTAAGDYSMAAGYEVTVTGNNSFGFGQSFTCTNSNTIIFAAPSDAMRLGINITPTYAVQLPNNANNSGQGIANAWYTYSSIRWKENISQIENPLDKVMALRGVYFDWKQDQTHDIGLIAEEVGEVIPEVVTYEENGVDAEGLDYARLTALLVEAIKQQQKEIESLKAKIKTLETDNR